MTAAGLIFSNIHDECLPELTRLRTMASVPFGGRYRLIDFPLSNMVNSGISKIGIITHYNYQSLLDHIGTGKDWDLARRSGGIKILPPFITAYDAKASNSLYSTRLEALLGVTNFISRCTEDVLVLSDCDIICNIDLSKVLAQHEETGADITVVTKRVDGGNFSAERHSVMVLGDDGRILDCAEYSQNIEGSFDVSTNIMVITRRYLITVLNDAAAHGYTSFFRDIIARNVGKADFRAYRYEGYYSLIGNLPGYFETSMSLLDPEVRGELFEIAERPVFTKVRNSAPTSYAEGAKVSNSIVADGCVIEGEVENCVVFRGVKVGKGTVVRNSILLQDTYVGENVNLNCVITDKNAVIRDGRNLSGHETMPFYIGKGIMV
ncbi:MAG: glucose-1-phosphate adenylyltransferase subunit GlgD [Clostridia bacterium]|nr:glucose-1-phosphate adenylyltransferase subunit GlgD [Clostridia bacterium]